MNFIAMDQTRIIPASGIRECHRQWLPECRCLSCRHLADSFGSMLASRAAAVLRTNPSLRTTSCPQVLVLSLNQRLLQSDRNRCRGYRFPAEGAAVACFEVPSGLCSPFSKLEALIFA